MDRVNCLISLFFEPCPPANPHEYLIYGRWVRVGRVKMSISTSRVLLDGFFDFV